MTISVLCPYSRVTPYPPPRIIRPIFDWTEVGDHFPRATPPLDTSLLSQVSVAVGWIVGRGWWEETRVSMKCLYLAPVALVCLRVCLCVCAFVSVCVCHACTCECCVCVVCIHMYVWMPMCVIFIHGMPFFYELY